MAATFAQPRDDVRINRPCRQAAVGDSCPGGFVVRRDPGELGGTEVRIEPEPGQFRHPWLVPRRAQAIAQRSRSAVLPDDRAARRGERAAVPYHQGFPLVRDPDGPDGHACRERLPCRGKRRLPDPLGQVFHPPWLWVVLTELGITAATDLAVCCDDESSD